MPTLEARRRAAELQRQLATLTAHQRAHVKPYGKHLLIQMHRGTSNNNDEHLDTIARLTEIARNSYSAAFRSHTGPCEPLPGNGNLATVAAVVVSLLGTYFEPNT